ncbi:hypothetical protein Mapa_014962 [Marchantia paleacea]|nr:hypothetical protein Mapa_014962 [Marchantia paleacea]
MIRSLLFGSAIDGSSCLELDAYAHSVLQTLETRSHLVLAGSVTDLDSEHLNRWKILHRGYVGRSKVIRSWKKVCTFVSHEEHPRNVRLRL